MTIKEVMTKAAKGETLTEDERKLLADFDPQRDIDSAAAAARKAEKAAAEKAQAETLAAQSKLAQLQQAIDAKADEGKSDLEKSQGQIAELSKSMKALQEQLAAKDAETASMKRGQEISGIRTRAGIQFIEGLDQGMLESSFANSFEGLADLSDETVIKTKVDTWRAMNAAAIIDTSGNGTGAKSPTQPAPRSNVAANDQEREQQLINQGIL